MNDLVEKIRFEMDSREISQEDLAKRAKIAQSTLSRILDGTTASPRRRTLINLLSVLGVEM